MVESIVTVLMRRDGMPKAEAEAMVENFKYRILEALDDGQDYDEIYEEFKDEFGLEPDYMDEVIF
jgi:hypothetical protein